MAKSIRSKRMRKLRAFKRIRYGEKELLRLKNMLAKAAEEEKIDVSVDNGTDNLIMTPQNEIHQESTTALVNSEKPPSSKYPCWLSHFKIRRLAKQERKQKRKEAKRLKKEKKSLHKRSKKKAHH